jgi:chemotaxis protein methyltransferase CheR
MAQSSTELRHETATPGRIRLAPPELELRAVTDHRDVLAHALTETVREPLIVLDRDLRIVAASRTYREMFPAGEPNGDNHRFCEVNALQWDSSVLDLLRSVLSEKRVIEDHEIELDVPELGRRTMLLNARQLGEQAGADLAMVVGLKDLTATREADALRTALRENQEMLIAEVQHRVANSLQIIASILLLKARAVQSEETRLHLHDVHHRLLSVATVQRQLSVSRSGNDVELGPYLRALCQSLESSMVGDDHEVTITASVAAGSIKSEDAVSFGLIVTELVINSLKHGFPNGRKGHIAVQYAGEKDNWRLTVSDDGVGRLPDVTLLSPHVGLGTSIVEALARSLNAQVVIRKSLPGAATAIVHSA